jgi:hypothetical protein
MLIDLSNDGRMLTKFCNSKIVVLAGAVASRGNSKIKSITSLCPTLRSGTEEMQ